MIAIEEHRKPTCHPYQSLFSFLECHIVVSALIPKDEKLPKCPWFSALHATGQSPRARMLHVLANPRLTHVQHFQITEQNVVPSRSCFFPRSTCTAAAKDTQFHPRHPFHISMFLTSQQVTSLSDVHHLSRQAVFKLSTESLIISPRTNPVPA